MIGDKMAISMENDRIYEECISLWLPPRIIDCHAHVGLKEHCGPIVPERYAEIWAMEVGITQSWERLRQTYRALFPRQEVSVLAFGGTYREMDTDRHNDYVLSGLLDARNRANGLCVTRPEWNAGKVEQALSDGFIGIKPYPDFVAGDSQEISIYDFLPRAHLAVLNEHGGILMMHLPRARRLADPDNIRELLDISDDFPSIKLILAHVGRAYCLPTAKIGLPHLADREGIFFDTAANLNADVFEYAMDTIGPDRLLFGSDLPVTLMRGVREHIGETYVNYTDGPYSWNVKRKSPEEESDYTYYLYEELRALITATIRGGFGIEAIEKMLYHNSKKLLGLHTTEMAWSKG